MVSRANQAMTRQPQRSNTVYFRVLVALLFLVAGNTTCIALDAWPIDFETVRTRGMGGACTAIADDQQALLVNPAGLHQIKDNRWAILDVAAERNAGYAEIEGELGKLSDADTPEARRTNDQVVGRTAGKSAYWKLSNQSWYLGANGFGMSLIEQAWGEVRPQRPTNPRIRVQGGFDTVLSGSLSRPVWGHQNAFSSPIKMHWGGTMKYLARRGIDREYLARDFATLTESDLRDATLHGGTLDLDSALMAHLETPLDTTLGIHIENLLHAEVDSVLGRLPRRARIGAAIRPLTGDTERRNRLVLALDIVDLTGDDSLFKRVRMGAEARRWPRDWMDVRAGLRGGYLSFGATGRFQVARIDFATYSEELGSNPGFLEDRRYSISLGLEF